VLLLADANRRDFNNGVRNHVSSGKASGWANQNVIGCNGASGMGSHQGAGGAASNSGGADGAGASAINKALAGKGRALAINKHSFVWVHTYGADCGGA